MHFTSNNLPFKGTVTALITPFNESGDIDYPALGQLIEMQIKAGISAIVPCGSTGEGATLSTDEKVSVIKYTIDHVAGRIPVIAGTGSNDTRASIMLTKIAAQAGADAVLLVAPYYNKPMQSGLYAHFRAIAEACDIPQILYNVPGRTAQNMLAETQLRLAESFDHIVGTKEASANLEQIMEIIRYAPPHFSVLAGDDSLALPVIASGGHGVISVLSNYAPAQFGALIQHALHGDFEQARQLHYHLFSLMKLNFIETNPIPVKAALSMMGYCQEIYRLPLEPITPGSRLLLRQALINAGFIQE
jgi:4-hydroxy-tetrahydrodipicolinate synthase